MAASKHPVFVRDATGLVREISAFDAVAINIIIANLVIGSVGLLVLPYTFPGVNLVGAVIVAAIASFSLAVVYWLFSYAMPRSGGDYVWNTRVLNPPLGFAANFSLTIWTIFYIAAYAGFVSNIGLSGFLTTVGTVYGNAGLVNLGGYFGTANGTFIVATIVNIVMAALVATGLRTTLTVQRVLAVIAFIGTITAIVLVAVSTNAQFIAAFAKYGDYNKVISDANSSGLFPVVQDWNQLIPTFFGIGFAAETLIFFQYSVYAGGEIKSAKKTAPIALLGSLGILTIAVLVMAYGMSNVFGNQFLGAIYGLYYGASSNYPLGSVPPSYVFFSGILAQNPFILYLIGIGITVWSLSIVPFLYLTMSRNVMAWSFDRVLPETLSKVNERFHSPINAIIFAFILSEAFLIPYTYVAQFVQFFAASTAGLVIDFFITAIAGIVFPLRKSLYKISGISEKKVGPVPLISLAGVIATVFVGVLLYGFFSNPGFLIYVPGNLTLSLIGYGVAFSLFIAGFVIYYLSTYIRKTQGIDLHLALSEIPPE
jgi:amino acid transporter